jgi:hypothetical protein
MANRTIVTALLVGLSLTSLTACPKKAEPTVEAGVPDAAVIVLVPPDTDAAVAQFDAGTTPVPVIGAHPTTAPGTVGSGAAAAATAAEAAPVASAPGPGECCCEVAGQPLASLGQSECTKAKHGKCVKKERCGEAALKPVDGTKNCCCNVNGTKSVMGQSDCARGGKGQCIKMHECNAR